MRTSLVIETFNAADDGPDSLADTLACVRAQRRRPDEVLVVDGATPASPGLRRAAAASYPEARWIDAPAAGYYQQKNAGAAAATGDAIVFLDSDISVGADWLERLLATLEAGAAVVSGSTAYEEAPLSRLFTLSVFADYLIDGPGPVRLLIANNFAARADVWRACGGFPEVGRRGGCTLLAASLRRAGHDVICEPAAVARHRLDATPRHLLSLQLQFGYSAWVSRRRDPSLPGGRLAHLGPASPFLLAGGWLVKDLLRLPRAARRLGIRAAALPLYAAGLAGIRLVTLSSMLVALLRPGFFARRYGW